VELGATTCLAFAYKNTESERDRKKR